MRTSSWLLVVVFVALTDINPVRATDGRITCESPGIVQFIMQGAPNAVEAVGELRTLTLPYGPRPLNRAVVALECTRAMAYAGQWTLLWHCYETENSDPAYSVRVVTQGGQLQAVVAEQSTGEAEQALYRLHCMSRD